MTNKTLLKHIKQIRKDLEKDEQYFCGNCVRILDQMEELVTGKLIKKAAPKEPPKWCPDCDGPLVLSQAGGLVCDVGCQK